MITRYVLFSLALEAPCVLTQLESDADSASTIDFIPGSAIRGAVARGLCDQKLDKTQPELFRRLILSSEVRYLNAYVEAGNRRCLPTPVSFRCERYGDQRWDLAADPWSDGAAAPQIERFDESFLTLGEPTLLAAAVSISARFHHQRDREVGRATQNVGAIFRYESLDAGQVFRGAIAITAVDDAAVKQLIQLVKVALGDKILLGRSRRAGYGGLARMTYHADGSRETEGDRVLDRDVAAGELFRVLTTADFLGRNQAGQLDPTAIEYAIITRLGGLAEPLRRFFDFRRVGGFNRKWGLELPQALGLRAGSLMVLRATSNILRSCLLDIEHSGLGERRNEGFGRVLFLDQPLPQVHVKGAVNPVVERPTTMGIQTQSSQTPPMIRQMEKRLIEAAAMQAITEVAARLAGSVRGRLPSPSLLNRLRVPLRHNSPDDAIQTWNVWLGDTKTGLKKTARRQLEDSRVRLTDGPKTVALFDFLRLVVDERATEFDPFQLIDVQALARGHHIDSPGSSAACLTSKSEQSRWRVLLLDAFLATLVRRIKLDRAEVLHAGTN